MTSALPISDPAVDSEKLTFLELLASLDALGVTFSRRGATNIALSGGDVLTDELRHSALRWKLYLLNVCDCRTKLTRLHEYIIRLRCEDPPKGTRPQAFAYLTAHMERLAGLSKLAGGTERGWPDPADVFAAGDQIDGLRDALAELTREGAPYPVPLPPGCVLLPEANFDVFAAGRLYNGKLSTSGTQPSAAENEAASPTIEMMTLEKEMTLEEEWKAL